MATDSRDMTAGNESKEGEQEKGGRPLAASTWHAAPSTNPSSPYITAL
jgi:hypothetical protein